MKTHSREKSNKVNQCDVASSQTSNLKTHSHSEEKTNDQVIYIDIVVKKTVSSWAENLSRHMKQHVGSNIRPTKNY